MNFVSILLLSLLCFSVQAKKEKKDSLKSPLPKNQKIKVSTDSPQPQKPSPLKPNSSPARPKDKKSQDSLKTDSKPENQRPLNPTDPVSDSDKKTAQQVLIQVLRQYHLKTIQITVEQEIFLSAVKTSIKSQGSLSLKGEKFRLELKGNPSSLMLFDGEFLWYQADREEKTVFRLKEHTQMQILASFFSETNFFKSFHIKKSLKKTELIFFNLNPKKILKA